MRWLPWTSKIYYNAAVVLKNDVLGKVAVCNLFINEASIVESQMKLFTMINNFFYLRNVIS